MAKGKQASVTLAKKIDILLAVAAGQRANKKLNLEAWAIANFPESIHKGMLFRWKAAARAQSWHLLPRHVAESAKELPNWFREVIGLSSKNRDPTKQLPHSMLVAFDKLLCSRIHGVDGLSLNEVLRPANMTKMMKTMLRVHNETADDRCQAAKSHNASLWDRFEAGEMTAEEAKARCMEIPQKATCVFGIVFDLISSFLIYCGCLSVCVYLFVCLFACLFVCLFVFFCICS